MTYSFTRSNQGKHRSGVIYCGFVLSVSLSLVQIQDSPDALYAGKESKPDAGVVTPVQENQQPRQLEPRNPIERELVGEQSHSYQITFATGQYARLVVGQGGIDVAAKLFGPNIERISDFDSEIRTQGQETVEWVAEETGSYRLMTGSLSRET
jgi:hypothetical protein